MVFGRIFSDIRISAINVKTEHIEMGRQKNSVRQIIQYQYIKYHEWSLILIHRCNMDASKKLLILCREENAKITRYPERPRLMDNGVQHYFVEVTRKDRLQYGLLAYGEEAIALYKETMKTLGKNIQ